MSASLDTRGSEGDEPMLVSPARPCENELVRAWRRERAERLGYVRAEAETIALDLTIDLHLLERLLRGGCAPELALRIVR